MLHPAVAHDLIEREACVAREAHGQRIASLDVIGTDVICAITNDALGTVLFRFDGARYDAEPFAFSVIDADGAVAPIERWPAGLAHSEHPVLHRPFSCVRGCIEYHAYPGHTSDPWDHHRATLRLGDLLDHLLRKAGK